MVSGLHVGITRGYIKSDRFRWCCRRSRRVDFEKPYTPSQYLLCKIGAVALLSVTFELLHLGPQLHQHTTTLVDDRRVILARVDGGENDQAIDRVVVGKAVRRSRVAADDLSEAVDGTDTEEA